MSLELFNRCLQAGVGQNREDGARMKGVAQIIEQHMDVLIDDFMPKFNGIPMRPGSSRVDRLKLLA